MKRKEMSGPDYPSYLHLSETGKLKKIIKNLYRLLEACVICPRKCKVNRLSDELGFCQVGRLPIISSYAAHFGEEKPLVGRGGSGTIFMTHCNLKCIYCQNSDISHLGRGKETDIDELSEYMLHLQKIGCHNINFVTPTHVVPQIVAAVESAINQGLRLPLVYNCGGYESVEILRLIEGVFDIYMPDIKYANNQIAWNLSKAEDYPNIVKQAIKEMHRQVGDLIIDKKDQATRGLLVRHLVLPGCLAGTEEVLCFLADKISKNTYLNIMDQYRPCFKASQYPLLDRSIEHQEFQEAVKIALGCGLKRIDSLTDCLSSDNSLP